MAHITMLGLGFTASPVFRMRLGNGDHVPHAAK